MPTPVRIQLSRKMGFRLQEVSRAINGLEAVKVDRSTKWGNPFAFNPDEPGSQAKAVANFRSLFVKRPSLMRHKVLTFMRGNQGRGEAAILAMRTGVGNLRGKNLACWCKPGDPCHADVLLELANKDSLPAHSAA